MPIASMGGMVIDGQNNRSIPGAGGHIGGMSAYGANYALLGGAGKEYFQFTPGDQDNVIPIHYPGDDGGGDPGGGGGPVLPNPMPPEPVPIQTVPVQPVDPGGSTNPGGTITVTPPRTIIDPGGTDPGSTSPPTAGTIWDIIKNLLSTSNTRTEVGETRPLYLFNQQPQQGASTMNWKPIIIIGAGVGLAVWLYRKYAK